MILKSYTISPAKNGQFERITTLLVLFYSLYDLHYDLQLL